MGSKLYYVVAVVLVLSLCCSARADTLVFDDFNDGDVSDWTLFDGTFSVVDGVFNIAASGFCNDARAVIGDEGWSDYVIETDFHFTEGSTHASILFRIEEIASGCDAGRYYQFHIFSDHVGICRMNYSGGSCQILINAPAATDPDAWHHAALVVSGTSVAAYVDGAHVLSYDGLTHYSHGRVGLKNINSGINLYDDFEVYSGSVAVESRTWGDLKSLFHSAH